MKEYIKNGEKVLGFIDYEKGIYFSKRTKKHFFHLFAGFGLSMRVLDKLDKEKIETIVIEFEGNLIETTTDNFLINGIDWTDDSFGKREEQLILPLNRFKGRIKNIEIQVKL